MRRQLVLVYIDHDNRWRKHGGQRGREPSKDMAVVTLEA
jgi:hypothetical protein